jgi:hypothetical protein
LLLGAVDLSILAGMLLPRQVYYRRPSGGANFASRAARYRGYPTAEQLPLSPLPAKRQAVGACNPGGKRRCKAKHHVRQSLQRLMGVLHALLRYAKQAKPRLDLAMRRITPLV